jgi:anti-anti-sigma factor
MGEDSVAPLRQPPVRAVDDVDGAIVVHLAGELDLSNAAEVRAALAAAVDAAPRRIVVDLAEVEFVDSTTLGVLIEARSRIGRDRFALAAPQLETRRTLEVSGLDRHLPVHETVQAALSA